MEPGTSDVYREPMRLASLTSAISIIACGGHNSTTTDGNGDGSAGGPPTNITVTLTDQPTNAAMFSFLVAYQDGGGAWTIAPAPSGDTYTLPIRSAAYGVAWTCITAAGERLVEETHFAVSERTSLTTTIPPRCTDRLTNFALHGTITTANGNGVILTRFADRLGVMSIGGNPTSQAYTIETPAGTHDLVVLHAANQASANTDLVADATLVQRDVAVTAATVANANFITDSAAVQSFPVTITTTGAANASTTLYSANGTIAPLVDDSTGPAYETVSLAAGQMAAGDVYDQQVTVRAAGSTSITENVTATPAAYTWTAPASLGGAIASVMAAPPYPRVTTTWPAYSSAVGYGWAATQTLTGQQCGSPTACSITWTAVLSPGVIGMSPSYTMPDLSMLAGWPAGLAFVSGTMVTGTVGATTSTAGATDFPQILPPAAGTQRVTVRSDFTVTP